MKIGYFTQFPYKNNVTNELIISSAGGVGVVAYNLAIQMAKRGHDVHIFTSSIDSKEYVEKYENITIYRYKKSFTIGSAPISIDILYKPLRLGLDLDIVHAHAGNPPAPIAAYWYAKKKKKPFVVTYHGDGQWNWGGLIRRMSVYSYNKYLLDKLLSYADVVISPSEYYIDESRFLGEYRDKIVVIPNGINIDEFDINYSKEECREKLDLPLDDEIILFLGTLSPQKGPDVLLKAMLKIIEEVPETGLVFVGRGTMREELERLCKRLGIEKNVTFVGFVGDAFKKAIYYKSSDVLVFPSFSECFPIVNLEAMACGIPIVASKIGGIPDAVKDGENGLLVPSRDSNTLAEAIIYLLENKGVREKMGANGRKKVRDYSWGRIAEETEKVYISLMG